MPPRRSHRPARGRSPPGRCRYSTERARFGSCPDQIVEVTGALEGDQVIAAADMMLADEDLRNRGAAISALDHLLANLAAIIDRDLAILHALLLEQRLSAPAVRAEGLGINLDRRHRCSSTRHLDARFNA